MKSAKTAATGSLARQTWMLAMPCKLIGAGFVVSLSTMYSRATKPLVLDRTQDCDQALPVYCMETEPYTLPPSPADSIDNCHVMFVTKSTQTGNFGGQATADTHCSADAGANGNAIVASRMSSGYLSWVSSRDDMVIDVDLC